MSIGRLLGSLTSIDCTRSQTEPEAQMIVDCPVISWDMVLVETNVVTTAAETNNRPTQTTDSHSCHMRILIGSQVVLISKQDRYNYR